LFLLLFCTLASFSLTEHGLHGTENMAGFYTLQLQLMEKTQLLSLHPRSKHSWEETHWLNLRQAPSGKINWWWMG
jgi:hypothetical protein